jgi:pilus assembly protein CpaB
MAVRTRSLVLLFLALASGGLAAWLSLGYLRRQAQPLLNASTSGKAVVAARDLPAGAIVTENDIRIIDWPGNALPPGLLSAPQEAVGRGVLSPVRLNEPFLDTKLAPRQAGVGGLPILITDKMRAMSIRVDDVIGVAGFVIPGTRVDVLLTATGAPVATEPTTKVILQNIQALAAAQTYQTNAQGQPMPVPVVTVLVTPEQAETLAMAAHQGRIQLTLRNILDTTLVETTGAVASNLMTGVRGPRRQPPAIQGVRRLPVNAPRQPATEETIVEQFRGGERSLIRFSRPREENRDTLPEPGEN